MKITDIVALAKAGYKKSDIDKIIEEELNTPEPEPAPEPEPEPEPVPEEPAEEEPDYKTLYEAEVEKNKKVQDDLKKAQKANRAVSMEKNEKTDQETLEEIIGGFFS